MRNEPPQELVDLLARLHLASLEQVRAVQGRAQKLAGDLPLVESVWIDALAQQKLLTPFQAAECNAGRGQQLLVGPYVLQRKLQRSGQVEFFVAKPVQVTGEPASKQDENSSSNFRSSGRQFDRLRKLIGADASPQPHFVHLAVAHNLDHTNAPAIVAGIQNTIECFPNRNSAISSVARPLAVGLEGNAIWIAYQPADGVPAGQWISCHGRLPAAAVLEIARQMVAVMAELESAGISHGGISASSLMLGDNGAVQLLHIGMQNAVRLSGANQTNHTPLEAWDYLAPECIESPKRIAALGRLMPDSSDPSATSADIYASGCLWWHLLAGRPPFAGGDLATKLQAVRQSRPADIRAIAPDVPAVLATAVENCMRRNPAERIQSFAELSKQLGPPTTAGRRTLVNELLKNGRRINRRNMPAHVRSGLRSAIQPALAAAACLLLTAAATWPLWRTRPPKPDRQSIGSHSNVEQLEPAAIALEKLAADRQQANRATNALAAKTDRSIHLANYQTTDDVQLKTAVSAAAPTSAPLLELPTSTEIQGGSLRLAAGAIVRGQDGKRATIAVPPNGLIVDADHVRFENVDFVWRQRAEQITTPAQHALVELQSQHVEFNGCTFQAVKAGSFALPAAICFSDKSQHATALVAAMEARLENCAIAALAAGFDCRSAGPVAIELRNTLQSGGGPLVRFPRPRRIDAPVAINLEHVTARGGESVVEFGSDRSVEASGTVTLCANACVFSPADSGALICVKGKTILPTTSGVLKSLDWTGQGSLVSPQLRMVARTNSASAEPRDARRDTADSDEANAESDLSLEGLVSSPFEFAGAAGSEPDASQVRRWLAPLRSEQPPGIGNNLPHLPAVE